MSVPVVLDPGVGLLICAAFALLFAQAAYHKWQRLAEFGAIIANYRLLPRAIEPLVAPFIPTLETLVAAFLLPPATRVPAALVGALLLLAYAAGIAINLGRGRRDVDCGCSGPADRRPIGAWMVWRNLLLVLLLALVLLPWSARVLQPVDLLTMAGGLLVAALLYAALDHLYAQVVPRGAVLRGAR